MQCVGIDLSYSAAVRSIRRYCRSISLNAASVYDHAVLSPVVRPLYFPRGPVVRPRMIAVRRMFTDFNILWVGSGISNKMAMKITVLSDSLNVTLSPLLKPQKGAANSTRFCGHNSTFSHKCVCLLRGFKGTRQAHGRVFWPVLKYLSSFLRSALHFGSHVSVYCLHSDEVCVLPLEVEVVVSHGSWKGCNSLSPSFLNLWWCLILLRASICLSGIHVKGAFNEGRENKRKE